MNIYRLFNVYRDEVTDPAAPPASGTPPAADPAPAGDWRTGLPADLQADMALKSINSLDDLAKGYVGLNKMMGSRVPIPGKDAAPEVITEFRNKLAGVDGVLLMPTDGDEKEAAAFYTKLGRPESPEGYKVQRPQLPEGMVYNEGSEKAALKAFHAAGLNGKQAQAVLDAWNNVQLEAHQASAEEDKAARIALETKWGAAYPQNIGIAKMVLEKYGNEQLKGAASAIEQSPAMAEMLSNLGRLVLEDTVVRTISGGGDPLRSVEEIDADIAEITNNPAYSNGRHPDNKKLVAKATALFQEKDKLQIK